MFLLTASFVDASGNSARLVRQSFYKRVGRRTDSFALPNDGQHGWVMGASVAHTPHRSPQFRVHDHVHDEVGATAT
jgi:hypothetical protein